MQYTAQFNRAGFVNVLFGQSYQLFGQNSFAVADAVNTGLTSGLESQRSDYVARVAYQPDNIYTFISRFLLDENTFQRAPASRSRAARTSIAGSSPALYGNYDAQPEIGFLERRQGVTGQVTFKFTQNWSVLALGALRSRGQPGQPDRVGLGYIDDCFAISLNYMTDYNYSGTTTTDNKVMLVINLRTIGGSSFSQSVNPESRRRSGGLGCSERRRRGMTAGRRGRAR